jgi:hypothetical protein
MNIGQRRPGIWFLSAFFRKALTVIGHFLLMNSFIFYAMTRSGLKTPPQAFACGGTALSRVQAGNLIRGFETTSKAIGFFGREAMNCHKI